ncbi:MAG TPA: hypothetical protein ENK61_01025 [Devosia sp.]|nr:hypothetical protein [Devosia sp.]
MFSSLNTHAEQTDQSEERQLALEYIADAWNSAEADGIDSEALSHAALFAALATLVRAHGEEETAKLIADLPIRISNGEYSLNRSIQ